MNRIIAVLTIGALALGAYSVTASAGDRNYGRYGHASKYYRGGSKVRGYVARRGGYSYNYTESINTYGDARNRYGSAWSLRDPSLDKQTNAGPFDHGFFFDSGITARGGDSPYLN